LELAGLRLHLRLQKGRLLPPLAVVTHSASETRVRIMLTSTPPSHTINRAELAGIDIGLQLNHTCLLTDNACSLRLIQGFMNCPSAFRHHIRRDALALITHTLKTCCTPCIRTRLGIIKVHNHTIGNGLANTLANQVSDGHPPDTNCTTDSYLSIGTWTWPYTIIPQTLGVPQSHRYTNLKTDAHMQHQTHPYAPLTDHQARRPRRPRRCGRGGLHPPQKTNITNQCPIHTQT
jgi:hypothetical protein